MIDRARYKLAKRYKINGNKFLITPRKVGFPFLFLFRPGSSYVRAGEKKTKGQSAKPKGQNNDKVPNCSALVL